jgi:hypothetical protein
MTEPNALRVHRCALNARDLDTLARQAAPHAPCLCDGEWVGEGPQAVRDALEREFQALDDVIVRFAHLDGEPVVVGFDAGGEPKATFRIDAGSDGRIRGLRIDHDAAVSSRLVPEPDL